jgi:hypothetical protein
VSVIGATSLCSLSARTGATRAGSARGEFVATHATPAWETGAVSDPATERLATRLVESRAQLHALRPAAEAGEPWPPSANFGVGPEAHWNPPELLAHLAEMLPYWLGQIERIVEGYPEPVSFGRVQSDEERIAAIGRDRRLPVGELYGRIDRGCDEVAARLRAMSADELGRVGTHPTLGEMTVAAVIERMFLNHFADHVAQLGAILEPPDGGR